VPTGDDFRHELDAYAFAGDIMDYLLVKLPADNPVTADSLVQDKKDSLQNDERLAVLP
jgi:BarA-like signal transduction histidine kinase